MIRDGIFIIDSLVVDLSKCYYNTGERNGLSADRIPSH